MALIKRHALHIDPGDVEEEEEEDRGEEEEERRSIKSYIHRPRRSSSSSSRFSSFLVCHLPSLSSSSSSLRVCGSSSSSLSPSPSHVSPSCLLDNSSSREASLSSSSSSLPVVYPSPPSPLKRRGCSSASPSSSSSSSPSSSSSWTSPSPCYRYSSSWSRLSNVEKSLVPRRILSPNSCHKHGKKQVRNRERRDRERKKKKERSISWRKTKKRKLFLTSHFSHLPSNPPCSPPGSPPCFFSSLPSSFLSLSLSPTQPHPSSCLSSWSSSLCSSVSSLSSSSSPSPFFSPFSRDDSCLSSSFLEYRFISLHTLHSMPIDSPHEDFRQGLSSSSSLVKKKKSSLPKTYGGVSFQIRSKPPEEAYDSRRNLSASARGEENVSLHPSSPSAGGGEENDLSRCPVLENKRRGSALLSTVYGASPLSRLSSPGGDDDFYAATDGEEGDLHSPEGGKGRRRREGVSLDPSQYYIMLAEKQEREERELEKRRRALERERKKRTFLIGERGEGGLMQGERRRSGITTVGAIDDRRRRSEEALGDDRATEIGGGGGADESDLDRQKALFACRVEKRSDHQKRLDTYQDYYDYSYGGGFDIERDESSLVKDLGRGRSTLLDVKPYRRGGGRTRGSRGPRDPLKPVEEEEDEEDREKEEELHVFPRRRIADEKDEERIRSGLAQRKGKVVRLMIPGRGETAGGDGSGGLHAVVTSPGLASPRPSSSRSSVRPSPLVSERRGSEQLSPVPLSFSSSSSHEDTEEEEEEDFDAYLTDPRRLLSARGGDQAAGSMNTSGRADALIRPGMSALLEVSLRDRREIFLAALSNPDNFSRLRHPTALERKLRAHLQRGEFEERQDDGVSSLLPQGGRKPQSPFLHKPGGEGEEGRGENNKKKAAYVKKKKNAWLDDLDQILAGGLEGQVEHETGKVVDTNCLGRVVLRMIDDDKEEELLLKRGRGGRKREEERRGRTITSFSSLSQGDTGRYLDSDRDGDEGEEDEEENPDLRAAIRESLIPIGVLSSGSAFDVEDKVGDLLFLSVCTPASIVHVLRKRFQRRRHFTSCGNLLICLLPPPRYPREYLLERDFNDDVQWNYYTAKGGDLCPHPFLVARKALENVWTKKKNQFILTFGEFQAFQDEIHAKMVQYLYAFAPRPALKGKRQHRATEKGKEKEEEGHPTNEEEEDDEDEEPIPGIDRVPRRKVVFDTVRRIRRMLSITTADHGEIHGHEFDIIRADFDEENALLGFSFVPNTVFEPT
ncbi:iq calmodulin-binding motif domain-containing, partial [Cystoisospora suis]